MTCQGSCGSQDNHKFSVPPSALARKHARLGKPHDLSREPLSGDHGRLPARSITVATWTACWRSAPAAILYCATSFPQEASMSPRSRPSLCIFSHLGRGLRTPLKSAAVRFPPLPSHSSLSTRHASNPKRRGTMETRERERALPPPFVMRKARTVLLIVTLFASRQSCVMKVVVHIRLKFHSPFFPVGVSTVEDWDSNGVPCPGCHPLQLSCCKCLAAPTGSRPTEEDE